MRKTLGVCAVIVAAALLLSSHPARADVSMGYEARYVGLGGAGLALIDNPTQAALVNPAALSLRPTRFGIQYPNLGFRLDGTGLGSVLNTLSDLSITGGGARYLPRPRRRHHQGAVQYRLRRGRERGRPARPRPIALPGDARLPGA